MKNIADKLRIYYPQGLSEQEAFEAAQNLVRFIQALHKSDMAQKHAGKKSGHIDASFD